MKKEITKYYNNLATKYDEDRFSNSYGEYIHQQENRILRKYLFENRVEKNLDLACGTGRFLNFANHGVDISEEMIKVSKHKFPNKKLQIADAENLPFENNSFENVISFHLFMHLNMEQIDKILLEVNRVLEIGGYFIFDIPSQKRRSLSQHQTNGWHGANQASLESILKYTKRNWQLVDYHGIAFFPIHRIATNFRKYFRPLDNYFCESKFKEYSSHLIFILKKI